MKITFYSFESKISPIFTGMVENLLVVPLLAQQGKAHAREIRVSPSRPPFFLAPMTSKRLFCRLLLA